MPRVRFPPHEPEDQSRAVQTGMARFHIRPVHGVGKIQASTKHIVYSSMKRNFTEDTGLPGLDAFEYSFEHGKAVWNVTWDMHVGLVRITPFFKAVGFKKTVPKRAIEANRGLSKVAFSITGGTHQYQGYWMPFDCARALCSRFCYEIRYALIPIFGPRFASECVENQLTGEEKWVIPASTIRSARDEVKGWANRQRVVTAAPQGNLRSEPEEHGIANIKTLPSRGARPSFKSGSPFDAKPKMAKHIASPSVSPKSSYADDGWTAINREERRPKGITSTQPRAGAAPAAGEHDELPEKRTRATATDEDSHDDDYVPSKNSTAKTKHNKRDTNKAQVNSVKMPKRGQHTQEKMPKHGQHSQDADDYVDDIGPGGKRGRSSEQPVQGSDPTCVNVYDGRDIDGEWVKLVVRPENFSKRQRRVEENDRSDGYFTRELNPKFTRTTLGLGEANNTLSIPSGCGTSGTTMMVLNKTFLSEHPPREHGRTRGMPVANYADSFFPSDRPTHGTYGTTLPYKNTSTPVTNPNGSKGKEREKDIFSYDAETLEAAYALIELSKADRRLGDGLERD